MFWNPMREFTLTFLCQQTQMEACCCQLWVGYPRLLKGPWAASWILSELGAEAVTVCEMKMSVVDMVLVSDIPATFERMAPAHFRKPLDSA